MEPLMSAGDTVRVRRSRTAVCGLIFALAGLGVLPFAFATEGNEYEHFAWPALMVILLGLILGIGALIGIQRSQGRTSGRRIAWWANGLALVALVGLGVSFGFQVYRVILRTLAEDQMRRPILIAIHRYHDDHLRLPPY